MPVRELVGNVTRTGFASVRRNTLASQNYSIHVGNPAAEDGVNKSDLSSEE
jgi:hypothetical protein